MNTKTDKKFFSKIGLFLFLGTIIMVVSQTIGGFIGGVLAGIFPALAENSDLPILSQMLPLYIIGFPLTFLLMKKIPSSQTAERKKMTIGQWLITAVMCIGIMYSSNIVGLIITYVIGIFKQSEVANVAVTLIDSLSLPTMFLLMVICAPIFEELLFRKVLIDKTAKYGEGISIVLSGTLFGLFHGNLNQFVYAFTLGCFFAFIYVKTRNVKYTIALHMFINFLGSIVSTLVMSSDFVTSISEAQSAGAAQEELMAIMMADISGLLGYYAYIFLLVGGCIIGVVLLIALHKKFKLNAGEVTIEKGQRFKTVFLNVGMILFSLFWIANMVLLLLI